MRIARATYIPARLALGAAALALSACGSGSGALTVHGPALTIYTSLPLHGVSSRAAEEVAAGERLALADARGRVGRERVKLVELDDSDPNGETWDPAAVEANAKRAASDPTTIAYIGELGLGGSAVSLPVSSGRSILQVSPADGLTSLTQVDPSGYGTSPARFYSGGRRSFLRLVPTDLLQAATLVSWAHEDGASGLAIVHDDRLAGRELASQAQVAAQRAGLPLTDVVEAKADPAGYPALAQAIAAKGPTAVIYAGLGGAAAGPLLRALHYALPDARLYGSASLADAEPPPAGLPDVAVVSPSAPPSAYPPSGRRVLTRLALELGAPVDVEALYGYEAMSVVLDSIARAGRKGRSRDAVVRAALRPRARESVLGPYRLLGTGDVSTTTFATYRLARGRATYLGERGPGAAGP